LTSHLSLQFILKLLRILLIIEIIRGIFVNVAEPWFTLDAVAYRCVLGKNT